jgi:hypothetical protein
MKKKIKKTLPAAPPMPEAGMHNVCFSKDELTTLISLMNIASKTFEILALNCVKDGDDDTYNILSARQKLSSMYATRLSNSMTIGEPESRDFH